MLGPFSNGKRVLDTNRTKIYSFFAVKNCENVEVFKLNDFCMFYGFETG